MWFGARETNSLSALAAPAIVLLLQRRVGHGVETGEARLGRLVGQALAERQRFVASGGIETQRLGNRRAAFVQAAGRELEVGEREPERRAPARRLRR